ncbi:zinc-dependent alcohol dehydrogenase family protein [Chryseobacterium sp. ISL-6]|uniref:zinc-dependent alcohol dehydrogenase family protein n=1 Tax=Chryseobacterium sp. ISL-6 TaxID=2819143 RepID=UPI001BED0B11|nr:zinc-dependent alcohol dehydrogenase family protein [Chryseobacterium sp. ISL-6]MBT2620452.1 zinc-dependent alcohol dehydrogenase family protein [Chryseobacterium sp. ISL-6]
MKAQVLEQFGKPLVLKEINKPEPKDHEVLVKIKASGLNPLDVKIKNGQAAHAEAALPMILSLDMAGVVEEVGKDVHNFKVGDEVFGLVGGVSDLQGTLAEYIAADADLLALKPKNISFYEAAATPLVFITAWEALVDQMNIQQNQTVLIHGGSGGVGHVAIQIAKAKGAKVYTTVAPYQVESIKKYGAESIDYQSLSVEDYVETYTNGVGFDAILDTVGGNVLESSFKAVKRYSGHVASILGWGSQNLAPLSFRNGTYSGVFSLYPLLSGKSRKHFGKILNEAVELFEQEKLKIILHPIAYTLENANEAYTDLENKKNTGKLVIEIH